MKRRRSPQEKKVLSYAKDRRNVYGENDKSSRKAIRLRKKAPHRANRRRSGQILDSAKGAGDVAERLEVRRAKSWRKVGDGALGQEVQDRLERRARKGIDEPARNAARIRRVRRRLRLPS